VQVKTSPGLRKNDCDVPKLLRRIKIQIQCSNIVTCDKLHCSHLVSLEPSFPSWYFCNTIVTSAMSAYGVLIIVQMRGLMFHNDSFVLVIGVFSILICCVMDIPQ